MFPLPVLSWQTKLIVIAGIFLIGVASGGRVHSWMVDADEKDSIEQGLQTTTELHKDSAKIIKQRDAKEDEVRVVYRTIYQRINDAPSDRVCFTPDSLKLWNDAIAGADSHRPKPAEAAEPADPIGASEKDILRNGAENFEKCRINSLFHNALIDKVESLDGKMCVCKE